MKKILFFVIIVGMSLTGYAQEEFNTEFKAIPPKNKADEKDFPSKEAAPKDVPPKVTLPDLLQKRDSLLVDPKTPAPQSLLTLSFF